MREDNKFLIVRNKSGKAVSHFEKSKVSNEYNDELRKNVTRVVISDLENKAEMSFIKIEGEDRFRLDHLFYKPEQGQDNTVSLEVEKGDKDKYVLVWDFVSDHELNLFLNTASSSIFNDYDDEFDDEEYWSDWVSEHE